ncbi:MAG: hypothetical protein KAS73_09240 [Candidatus Sabulitectum sp.]|nr:hypothetical protein [Candidatus Sabulitectum sp.]
MKSEFFFYVLSLAVFALLACNSTPADQDGNVSVRQLVVVDSIGVEYGETCQVLGNISGAVFINDSIFVILDKGYQELRVFNRNCDHIATHSYQGNGPLEYRCAEYLVVAGSKFAVLEFNMPPRCVFFDQQSIPVSSVTFEGMTSLQEPCFTNDSTVVGFVGSIDRTNGALSIGYEICVWNAFTGIKQKILYTRFLEVDTFENLYCLFTDLENSITTCSSGQVFVATDSQDFNVLVFSVDGVLLDTLRTAHHREIRSASEIEQELIFRKLRDGSIGNWEPDAREPGITDLQIQDSPGYLWACHGSYFNPSFDVYTMDGELAFTCLCEGLPGDEMIAFGITDYGILAYTICPSTFPRVYLMELE